MCACTDGWQDQGTREWVVQSMAAMSSAQIVSAAALRTKTPISSTGLTNNITVTGLQSSRNSLQQVRCRYEFVVQLHCYTDFYG